MVRLKHTSFESRKTEVTEQMGFLIALLIYKSDREAASFQGVGLSAVKPSESYVSYQVWKTNWKRIIW